MKMHLTPIMGSPTISLSADHHSVCLAFTCLSAWAVIPITGHSSDQGTRMGDRTSYTQQSSGGPCTKERQGRR